MKKLWTLLKVSLSSMLANTSGSRVRRGRKISGAGTALLLAFVMLYISGVYSAALMTTLAPMGMEELGLIFMGIAALVSGLLFTAFAVSSTVFGGKDNDLMLSMPVSDATLMLARVSAIYLENLLLTFFMLVPAGVVCAVMTQGTAGRTVGFWLRTLLAVLALPLLDTALSVLLGALIAWISSRITRRALGKNLIMGAYIAAVFWFSFNINGMLQGLAAHAAGMKAQLSWALPLVWMGDGMMGDWAALGRFALCSAAAFALVILALSRVFRKMVTTLSSVSARSDYRLSEQRFSGRRRALLAKESRRFFGTTLYFWNAGLGFVMLLVAGAAALIKKNDLLAFAQQAEMTELLLPAACAVSLFCLSTGAIAALSYSLEGKALWILREAPVAEGEIIAVKTSFQLLLAAPCILISTLLLSIALNLSAGQAALLLAVSAAFEAMHALLGSLVGLAFARPELSEASVIKRSLASFLGIFLPMLLAVGLGALVAYASGKMGMEAALGAAAGLTVCIAIALAAALKAKGPKLLKQIG